MKKIIPILIFNLVFTYGYSQNTLDGLGLSSSSKAEVAFSLRKLSSTYSGPAIKVRRSTDNAKATVAFDGSNAVSASSTVTLTSGDTVGSSLGTSRTGTISTVVSKTGTITIAVNKTGTITIPVNTNIITGIGTSFLTELVPGDLIYKNDASYTFLGVVKSITSATSLILNNNTLVGVATASTFKTQNAIVTGSGTSFTSDNLSVGDRIYKSDKSYLGTITSISSNISMILNSRDAVAVSSSSFIGTSATVTGTGTDFSSADVGKMLISSANITIGIIASYNPATSEVTLTTKAGTAVSGGTPGLSFKSTDGSMNFSTFYSGASVFVHTWYDQSGNGRDLFQKVNANQPRIVSSGTLFTKNGRTAIEFVSASKYFLQTNSPTTWLANTLYTHNIVTADVTPVSNYQFVLSTTGGNGPNNTVMHYGYRSSNQYTVAQYGNDQNFEVLATSDLELHTAVKNQYNSSQFYQNGIALGTITSGAGSNLQDLGLLSLGYYTPTGNYYNGAVSEFTVYKIAISSTERTALDANQILYYGISTATWTGNIDTEWDKAGNWLGGAVPTESGPSIVDIPSTTNKPVIKSGVNAKAINIRIQTGATLTVDLDGTLQLYGTVTGNSYNCIINGTLEYKSNASQAILSSVYSSNGVNNTVKNLKISTTNGAVVAMSANLTVSGDLAFTTGSKLNIQNSTLTLGGTVTNTFSNCLRGSTNASIVVTGANPITLSFDQSSSGVLNILKNLTISNSSVITTDGNLFLNNNGTLIFSNNGKLDFGNKTLTIKGAVTNTSSGGLRCNGASVIVDGTVDRTLSFDQTTPGTTNVLGSLSIITTTSRTTSISGNIVVNGTLNTNTGEVLNLGTNSMSGTISSLTNSGTINTQNTSSTPIPIDKTWGGTVNYNSSSAQTAVSGTYNNLTINNAGGATANGHITVNGVLSLPSANPSATKGSLEMTIDYSGYPGTSNTQTLNSYILTMGSSSTTTGIGDVTGIVKRTTINANTSYSFGNQYTTIALSDGIMPSALSVTITIGSTPPGTLNELSINYMKDAIKRTYEIIPTVPEGYVSTARLSANFHYLDAELVSSISPNHSNTESKLVTWDYDIPLNPGLNADEHGRSSYDFTNNYLGFSNIPMNYFINITGHAWRTIFSIRDYAENHKTWNGSASSDWHGETNWTPVGIPGIASHIIIPSTQTTNNDPVLPSAETINTLTIENGGILNMGTDGRVITIQNSLSGGWEDQNANGNDPGNSKVVFSNPGATVSGNARFYNIEIANAANLTNQTGSTIKIENELTRTGATTGKWYTDIYDNTVLYNKSGGQTIVTPDGTGAYRNLTLSGSGVKTLPGSILTIHTNLTLSGTVSASPSHTLTIGGNLILGTGTTFIPGSLSHSIGGNFENNGCTFTSTGSTFSFNGATAQTIGGSAASTFNNVDIDNSAGVTIIGNSITTISGTLTVNNGKYLAVAPNKDLTTSGNTVINSPDGLVVKSDINGSGSYINSSSGSISYGSGSSAMVEQYIPVITARNYYFSTPLSSINTGTSYSLSGADTVFTYFEHNGYNTGWSGVKSTDTLIAGKGYVVHFNSSNTTSFHGELNATDITIANLSRTGSDKPGFNLIANPFPSAIDWDLMDTSMVYGTIWYRTKSSSYCFETYNSTSHAGTNVSGNGPVNRYVPALQSFWVRVRPGLMDYPVSLTIPNSYRVHQHHNLFKNVNTRDNLLRISVQNNNLIDETILVFDTKAKSTFESWDSEKMFSVSAGLPQLFTMIDSIPAVINGMPFLDESTSIPIYFRANQSGSYTLKANISEYNQTTEVILTDLTTGASQDLHSNPTYAFTSNIVNDTNRFVLNLKPATISGTVSYDNLAKTPLSGVQVILKNETGAVVDSTVSDAEGKYIFNHAHDGILTISAMNNAAVGGINAVDALQVLKHFTAYSILANLKLLAADANGNGYVNSVDALLIQKYFVQIINDFPASKWIFESVNVQVNQPGETIVQNIKGICRGDANGDFIP